MAIGIPYSEPVFRHGRIRTLQFSAGVIGLLDGICPTLTVDKRFRFTDWTSTSALTRPEQVRYAVNSSVGRFGRIDLLVNNARYGFTGAFEEMTEDEFKGQIDTNCWAIVNVTRAVLPILRARRSGPTLRPNPGMIQPVL